MGPDQVRRALLDAAAILFAQRGVDAVPLREIATKADVQLAAIRKYIGSRQDLVLAVFDDLSAQLAADVLEHPLEGHGFEADTVAGKWARIAASLMISGQSLADRHGFNPVQAIAQTIVDAPMGSMTRRPV